MPRHCSTLLHRRGSPPKDNQKTMDAVAWSAASSCYGPS
jgi:hypothetical protein